MKSITIEITIENCIKLYKLYNLKRNNKEII